MTSENFDPTKHKFGMAYIDSVGLVCHPAREDSYYDTMCFITTTDIQRFNYVFMSELTRAPEHDLIPRADVMELVSLIDCLIQNNPDDIISDSGHTVLQLWRHDAQRAITNFNHKYGEK